MKRFRKHFCFNRTNIVCLASIALVIFFTTENSYASELILITISDRMSDVIFDGRWTFKAEWKNSSLETLSYLDKTEIQLRTAHHENFIFVFVDFVSDTHLNKGSDRVLVCFDTKNDKTSKSGSDDYCFMSVLGRNTPMTFQGGSPFALNGYFKKIPNPEGLIGIGAVSDENDRYSKIPHPSYEFRIPTDLVGRSNNYGFYVGVFDSQFNKVYSWPQEIFVDRPFQIPSPSTWGDLVSPDNSLPEFEWQLLVLVSGFIFTLLVTKFRNTRHHEKHIQAIKITLQKLVYNGLGSNREK